MSGIIKTDTGYQLVRGERVLPLTEFLVEHIALLEEKIEGELGNEASEFSLLVNLKRGNFTFAKNVILKPSELNRTVFNKINSLAQFLVVKEQLFTDWLNYLLKEAFDLAGKGEIPVYNFYPRAGVYVDENGNRFFVNGKDHVNSKDAVLSMLTVENNLHIEAEISSEKVKEVLTHILNGHHKHITVLSLLWSIATMYGPRDLRKPVIFYTGVAGTGKSSYSNVFQTLWNMSKPPVTAHGITRFSLIKLSDKSVTVPLFIEEYKPLRLNSQLKVIISEYIRSIFDGTTAIRGTEKRTIEEYSYYRPLWLIGEVSFDEMALIDRTIFCDFQPPTADETQSYMWLKQNLDMVSEAGRWLFRQVLNATPEAYASLKYYHRREREIEKFKFIVLGAEILNEIFPGLLENSTITQAWKHHIGTVMRAAHTEAFDVLSLLDGAIRERYGTTGIYAATSDDRLYISFQSFYRSLKKEGLPHTNEALESTFADFGVITPHYKKRMGGTMRLAFVFELKKFTEIVPLVNFPHLFAECIKDDVKEEELENFDNIL